MAERPLTRWLAGLDPAELAEIVARRPDVGTRPPTDFDVLAERLSDPGAVAEIFAELPLPAVQVIESLILLVPRNAARMTGEAAPGADAAALAELLGRSPDDPELEATLRVLAQRALVWPEGGRLHLVGGLRDAFHGRPGASRPDDSRPGGSQAVRPPFDPHVPFTPVPPAPALAPVSTSAVSARAGGAKALLDLTGWLLDGAAETPVARSRDGAVAVREVRRLARTLGCDEPTVRLLVGLAMDARLLDAGPDGMVPAARYGEWTNAGPPARLATVLAAWWIAGGGPMGELRRVLVRVLDRLPPGLGVTDPASLAPLVRWTAPLVRWTVPPTDRLGEPAPLPSGRLDEPAPVIEELLREATLVGACALGAITPLGRALVEDRPVVEVAARLLASPADTLTSTVDLLDRPRTVESGHEWPRPAQGQAGHAARRPDSLRVRAVACAIRSDDEALLADLAAAPSLRRLRLTALAPTVLASQASPLDTLAALRAAGYAPVREDDTGAVVLERPRRRTERGRTERGRTERGRTERSGAAPVQKPAKPAKPGKPAERQAADPLDQIAERARHLSHGEAALLARAIRLGQPVRIDYVDGKGVPSTRVIEDLALEGHLVEAWCRLRNDERAFSLGGIRSVSPA